MKRRDPAIMAARQAEWEQMTQEERDAANAAALRRPAQAKPRAEGPSGADQQPNDSQD
jgi:hypothetical protein